MIPPLLPSALAKRAKEGTLRTLTHPDHLIDFSSNDFLGLAHHASIDSFTPSQKTSRGATGSRLISGNHHATEALEQYLARLHQSEAALMYNSGYNANVGLLSCIATKHDTILYDDEAHASIKDGARLSLAKTYSFAHNDPAALDKKLTLAQGEKFVVVESLYSMSGDYCRIQEIVEVCQRHQAHLIVDEAHTTGMYAGGAGWCVEQNMQDNVFARVITFGKAIGVFGACVLGSEVLRQFLINFSRTFIYTTALPPLVIEQIHASFRYIEQHPALIEDLFEKSRYFAQAMGNDTRSPIQSVLTSTALEKAKKLEKKGFYVKAILPPTVKPGEEMLRVCIHSFNTKEEITRLAEYLR